jgi:hypothetical protein
MAGDGGRVPDVSEQRADDHYFGFVILDLGDASYGASGGVMADFMDHMDSFGAAAIESFSVLSNEARPLFSAGVSAAEDGSASVLAALLAESPEATVAAIEALLTSDFRWLAEQIATGSK